MTKRKSIENSSLISIVVQDLQPRIVISGNYNVELGKKDASEPDLKNKEYNRPSELSSGGYADWAGDVDD